MTTGRINQVTVLRARHARKRESPHEAAGTGARALSPARVSHRPIKVVPPSRDPRGAQHPRGQTVLADPRNRVPSPPISHASGSLPRSRGPESNPSEETTGERPHLGRGLPERGVSPIDWLRSGLAQRLTDPHPSPKLATASKALCRSYLSRLQTGTNRPALRARPRSLPKRAHPARQAHQPLGPGTASRPQAVSNVRGFSDQAESTPGLSVQRSQHPFELLPALATQGVPPSRPASLRGPQQLALANS